MNTPEFRFKGFSGDWVQQKIGEHCIQLSATVNPQDTPDELFVEYSMPAFDNGESPEIVAGSTMNSSRKVLDKPCLLINKLNVRKKRIWNVENPGENAVSSTEFVPICSNEIDLGFLKHIVMNDTFTTYLEDCSSGTSNSQKRVTPDVIMSAKFSMPSYEEQTKIKSFLTNLDNLIILYQRKCDSLKELKKGMLQKMFPKEGAKVPEFRFKGFTGDWEQRKLGDVLQFQNGFNGGREVYGEGTAFISVMDILNNQFITYDCIQGKATVTDEELERFSVRYGDVLFQRSSENVEDAGTSNVYVDTENTAIFGGFVIRGRQIAPYSPRFMKYLLDTKAVRNQITKKAQGAQHVNVSQEILQDVQISLPSQKEQEAVESCLCNLDNLITLHQRKCDALKELKKGFLQKMFV